MEIEQAIKTGRNILEGVSDSPVLDTNRILLYVLNVSESAWLYAHSADRLTCLQAGLFKRLIKERATGKPLAYILGIWDFYGRTFSINKNVLIPRPATENLIDAALKIIQEKYAYLKRPLNIADIGTGSGCVAVTLALETTRLSPAPIRKIYATDISKTALRTARKNAAEYGVEDRIEFLQGDMLEPLAEKKVDLIVSNPPYVPTAELDIFPSRETIGLCFEPKIALDGGVDGQKYIQKITAGNIPAVMEATRGRISVYL